MPDASFLAETLKKYGLTDTPYQAFMVGDQLTKCLASAHACGLRRVYFSNVPQHRTKNCHALAMGTPAPDFSILDFRQLRYLVPLMDADAKAMIAPLPSQKRIKVGLLIDGNAKL
jgi:FMN phosphatase YigB (HAD superfamily)